MKRDDFGVRIDEIRELATKYSKPDLARMVQMGALDPQKAVMAGMMIDRIAQSAMKPPETTVAQDVLGQQPTSAQGQIPPGIMAAPGAPEPSAGVAALPSGITEMAGGGIVAFDEGGEVPGYADGDLVSASDVFRRGLANQPSGEMPPPASDPFVMPGGYRLREFKPSDALDIKGALGSLREAEREAGVDTEKLFREARAEEQARRAELAERRREAGAEALVMAGIGLMGARRGQEFETFAGVGRQAMQQYGNSLREIRESERDIKKSERELAFAEDKFRRDQSGKALGLVKERREENKAAEIENVKAHNKAVEKASELYMEQFKTNEAAKRALEVADKNGQYSIAVAKIHAMSANRPGETERLLGRYHNILATQGPEAANKFMNELGMVRGVGKPQNTMSFEEAMKIVSNDVRYAGKTLEEKMQIANQIVQAQPGLAPSVAPPTGGAAGANRPSLSSFDKP